MNMNTKGRKAPSFFRRKPTDGSSDWRQPPKAAAAVQNNVAQKKKVASNFKTALTAVPVPSTMLEGIPCVRVHANGKTKTHCYLTLSHDKFTLYVSNEQLVSLGTSSRHGNQRRMYTNSGKLKNLFRSKSEAEKEDEYTERAIDIGSIARIQRGQTTHKFELARKHHRLQQPTLLRDISKNSVQSIESGVSNQTTVTGKGSIASTVALTGGSGSGGAGNNGGGDPPEFRLDSKRSFSVIFRGDKTLDLMTAEPNRDEVVAALDRVIHTYQAEKTKVANDVLLLRYIWLDVDKDKSNTINADELARVLDRINVYMKRSELKASYEKFAKIIGLDSKARRKGLTFEQCCTFLHKIKRDTWIVKPVNIIWNDLFGEFMNNGKQRTSVSDRTFLEKFLHKKQGQKNATVEQVRDLFERLNRLEIAHVADSEPKDPFRIDKNRFEAYLLGRENDAFDPTKERLDKSLMTEPLSEYWINTSHNTYLTGDQFTSQSSVEMYLNSLYRGCRCLELDIWDGELDSINKRPIPIVYHGRTMTTKIRFLDIIKAIRVFLNFHPDTWPIILSFENHCSIPYQESMAETLSKVLGNRLYIPLEASLAGPLPSPKDLRGMVVIKGRRPEGAVGADDDDTDDESDDESRPPPQTDGKPPEPPRKYGVAPQLAKITLFHGTKHRNWDLSQNSPTHHMHSFSESKVKSLCRTNRNQKWTVYNQSHMTRTYPAGSRLDSSNYNPMQAWSTGCQLVALNFQTNDAYLRLNDGRFRENDGCGYVLKPSALMVKDEFTQIAPVKLSVRVLSGACIPKPKGEHKGECISPYVNVAIHDIIKEEKDSCTSYSTAQVNQNGLFPIWNQDRFFVFRVENGTVAMLTLTVYDSNVPVGSNDVFIASASIPVSCLRQGYRSVQLFDSNNTRNGAFDFASLLIEVKMRKFVAEI